MIIKLIIPIKLKKGISRIEGATLILEEMKYPCEIIDSIKNIKNYAIYIYNAKTIQSKIDKNLEYVETKKIDKQDINKESVNYETFFDNISNIQSHHFILGSPNYTYIKKYNIVFFPIYLTINNETKSRIGLIEFKKEDLPNIMDEDGDVDPDYTEDKLLLASLIKIC